MENNKTWHEKAGPGNVMLKSERYMSLNIRDF